MSLFTINISNIAEEVWGFVYGYVLQPIVCAIQDAINWIIYAFMWVAKAICDIFFSFLQTVYNFVLSILQGAIRIFANVINGLINTLRQKLPLALAVAVTPKAEEMLIRYAVRSITHSKSVKEAVTKGIVAGLAGVGIPFLTYLIGQVIDSIIPPVQIDVTNLLFPIQTLQQLSSDICCPIANVVTPQCQNACGPTGFPVCTPPCLELNNGNSYCFGLNFITATTTSTSTNLTTPPAATDYFQQTLSVTI